MVVLRVKILSSNEITLKKSKLFIHGNESLLFCSQNSQEVKCKITVVRTDIFKTIQC